MTNEEQAVTIVRKAKAWDALVSVLEAYTEPELSGVKTGVDALDGFIAVYQRQKAENARLAALVESGDRAIAHCVQGTKELGESLADAVKRAEWQPMSTAPIDGTRILLYRPGNGWCVVIAWWHKAAAMYGDEIGFFRDATHWMPLPQPPAALLAALGEPTNAGQSGEREPRLVERETRQPPAT